MPEFDYRAVDSTGQSTNGRMVATSANDVVLRLSQQGLVVQGLQIVSGMGNQVPQGRGITQIVQGGQGAQGLPQVQPIQQQTYSQPVTQTSPQVNQYATPAARVNTGERKLTGFFKDYDLWMLLSQMGTILRAGISSTEMLHELSNRSSIKGKARRAMEDMAKLTAQGAALSDAMEVYPEIFPDGVVGSVRAGEVGGYLPDALTHTSEQIQASWKLRRAYLWTGLSIFSTVTMIPFIWVIKGMAQSMADGMNSGKTSGYVEGVFQSAGSSMLGLPGFALLAMTIVFLFGPYVLGRIWFLPMRHKLSASLPLIGRRTRMESSRELSFHLERLSVAGVSAYRSFAYAAAAIPNKVYRDQMVEAGRPFREDASLSQMMPRKLVPDDLVDMVRTGEMTGTTHEAFKQMERLTAGEQDNVEKMLNVKAWVWVVLFVFGVSSLVAAGMMRGFYDVMIPAILDEGN